MAKSKVNICSWIPKEQRDKMGFYAKQQGSTMSQLVALLIDAYLSGVEKMEDGKFRVGSRWSRFMYFITGDPKHL